MKKLLLILGLILSFGLSFSQDLTFDSVRVTSPYWGAEVQTFVADGWSNCGNTNTNFVTGQTYKRFGFPINIVNLGTQPAYFGLPGVTPGVNYNWNQPGCWTQNGYGTSAPISIDSFVTAYLLDECKNVIAYNTKTAWYVQNNYTYAVDKSFGQWIYYTNLFGNPPTTGNTPNPTKDWLESNCGTLDTNVTIVGSQQLLGWDTNCQQCDSLLLFPSFGSTEYKFVEGCIIQLPNNFVAGNYYLVLDGNFTRFETQNCQPNRIEFPFVYNGSDGEVTFLSQDHNCVVVTPQPVTNVSSQVNLNIVLVSWTLPPAGTYDSFEITPVFVKGNTERKLVNRAKIEVGMSPNTVFDARQLRDDAIALGAGNGPVKYKFIVKTIKGSQTSVEAKTKQSLNIK